MRGERGGRREESAAPEPWAAECASSANGDASVGVDDGNGGDGEGCDEGDGRLGAGDSDGAGERDGEEGGIGGGGGDGARGDKKEIGGGDGAEVGEDESSSADSAADVNSPPDGASEASSSAPEDASSSPESSQSAAPKLTHVTEQTCARSAMFSSSSGVAIVDSHSGSAFLRTSLTMKSGMWHAEEAVMSRVIATNMTTPVHSSTRVCGTMFSRRTAVPSDVSSLHDASSRCTRAGGS